MFITIGWIFLGVLNIYYNHLVRLSQQAFEFNDYELETVLVTNAFAVFIGGLVGGSLMIFFLKDKLRRFPLGLVIIINTLSFILIIALVSILAFVFYYWLLAGPSYFDGDLWFNLEQFIFSYAFLLNLIVWTVISTTTMVILQVNDKYGRGMFLDSILGRYHTPKHEERIFMFLDLKSSTTIAEQLGHKKYFKLLNRFFDDVTKGVIESKGEIYQYVGDEIVITWKMNEGLEGANCVRCFFEIERIINKKAYKYMEKYKLTPSFKAALHGGEVTTGEVGTFKKDIVFTGDVLNTTSRIEDKCNEFGAKLLVSADLVAQLQLDGEFEAKEIGNVELRGKQNPVKVYTISRCFVGEEQLEDTEGALNMA
ncbi:Adenylate cyclase [Fulvivirga imtechensis AK7]|uniref:Adenylate cyclase n=1 Tax=Fulvivirga imtechensis AK7 TaxID=1237149 RepID=L8JX79_9BACT|nr:Adenylate cyclase [Fulvivirga imtechensis AK7]